MLLPTGSFGAVCIKLVFLSISSTDSMLRLLRYVSVGTF